MFSKRGRRYFFWSRHIALWELVAVAAVFAIPLLFAPLVGIANNPNGDYTGGYSGYQEYGGDHVSVWSWFWVQIHLFVRTYHDEVDALSTLVIAAFTVALAWSTWRLWRETERLAKGADQQTKRLVESINEARRSANAAEKAVGVTRDVGRADSRAYIVIKSVYLELRSTTASVEVEVSNIGKTPTRWIEVEANAQIIIAKTEFRATDIPLYPTGEIKNRWTIDSFPEPRRLPCDVDGNAGRTFLQLVMSALNTGRMIAVQGTVRWETMFGEVFESTFFALGVPNMTAIEGAQKLAVAAGVNTVTHRQVKWPEDTQ